MLHYSLTGGSTADSNCMAPIWRRQICKHPDHNGSSVHIRRMLFFKIQKFHCHYAYKWLVLKWHIKMCFLKNVLCKQLYCMIYHSLLGKSNTEFIFQLEQLEACVLRYRPHPMITHTSDSHQIPSQNKTKSKLQILKKLPKNQILKNSQ